MKQILTIAAAALLAACSAPQKPDYWTATRAGYGVADSSAADSGSYRAGAEAALEGPAVMRPGLHQTRTGAPWLVAHSAGFQAGGARLSGSAAAQAAIAYKLGERKSPYAAQTGLGEARTRFRIVTIDGSSFAVLFAIRMPKAELRAAGSDALRDLTAYAAQISGCAVTGPALVQRDRGAVDRLAAPVHCA